jgi:hypothetical protein
MCPRYKNEPISEKWTTKAVCRKRNVFCYFTKCHWSAPERVTFCTVCTITCSTLIPCFNFSEADHQYFGALGVLQSISRSFFSKQHLNTYHNNQKGYNTEAATKFTCNILFKPNPVQEASCNNPYTNTPLENKLPYQGQNIKPMEYTPVNNQRETLQLHAPFYPHLLVFLVLLFTTCNREDTRDFNCTHHTKACYN